MLKVTRREALLGAAGALVISGLLGRSARAAATRAQAGAEKDAPVTAWVRISPDNSVTLVASQSEMGQGSTTTLAAVLADELYIPFEQVQIEFSPYDPAYRDPVYQWMFTGNSQSISSFYDLMRTMGAAAREMLLQAASAHLQAPVSELTTSKGSIRHGPSKRSATFGEVASAAARLPVPAKPQLRSDSSLAGRRTPRWDIPAKVDGSARFGIDVSVPGMLVAAIRHAPRFGARLANHDHALLQSRPGVIRVVELPDGIAVVARTYWQAHRALEAADLRWSDEGSTFSSGDDLSPVFAAKLTSGPFFSHLKKGSTAVSGASPHTAVYAIPFQAHATLEPMNCTAHVTKERCDVWVPTQGVEMAQAVAAQVTGLPQDRITIHRTLVGGGFGRRLLADFVKETLLIAVATQAPVKVIWSREEDISHDFYRPAMLHAIAGSLDANGELVQLSHRVVSPSYMLYIFPRGMFPNVKDWTDPVAPPENIDTMAVEGLLEVPYDIPNQSVEQHRLEMDVPVSVWRTTGHGANNFVLESFIDELSVAAHEDPVAFRRKLLAKDARSLKVLDLAAQKAGWGNPLGKDVGRGIAIARAFGGVVAQVAELSVTGNTVKLLRIVAVVDCGRVLDPGIAESNILGGIVWGISGMKTAVTFENGRTMQANFDGFDPAHLWETPRCEVHFIDSGAQLGGTGELGPVPLHAAVCNAIYAATGRRIRRLPLSLAGLHFA